MSKKEEKSCLLGTVGGQAVLEGVMMKSKERYSVAVRKENGEIAVTNKKFVPLKEKYKILGIPLLRGIINFVEMMALSYKTLAISAEAYGEEIEETKFDIWLREKFGKGIMDVVTAIGMVLGMVLAVGMFFLIPVYLTKGLTALIGRDLGWFKTLFEGLVKIGIFVLYIYLVSFMKDIRRTFEYHGAEHKSIFCYESGEELTVENVKKYKRFHPRCGTSFIFVMLILSVIVSSFIPWNIPGVLRAAIKILLMPLIVGVGYEFIMYAGKHDNVIVKILSAPGLWMQNLTTREPDGEQIEVAIKALKCSLPSKFPDEEGSVPLGEEDTDNKKEETAKETAEENNENDTEE